MQIVAGKISVTDKSAFQFSHKSEYVYYYSMLY